MPVTGRVRSLPSHTHRLPAKRERTGELGNFSICQENRAILGTTPIVWAGSTCRKVPRQSGRGEKFPSSVARWRQGCVGPPASRRCTSFRRLEGGVSSCGMVHSWRAILQLLSCRAEHDPCNPAPPSGAAPDGGGTLRCVLVGASAESKNKNDKTPRLRGLSGSGEEGIRTLETVARLRDFQSRSFSRSDTSPDEGIGDGV